MVDLHSHILPEIDDGASSLEETRTMLALAEKDGITDIVATPHCNYQFEFDPGRCAEELNRVRHACSHAPQLYLGCEVHLTAENILRVLAEPRRYTLNSGDCLLVELPNEFTVAAVKAGLEACGCAGLRTVIAHPERNPCLQRDPSIAARLVGLGYYFQLTAQSLSGAFGSAAEKSAGRMLKQRLVHFVASDCHSADQRKPLLRSTYSAIAREFGQPAAELLFVLNPRAAVHGQPIEPMRPAKLGSTISRMFNAASISIKTRRWSATV